MQPNYSHSIDDFHPSILTDIYQTESTIAIWRRQLGNEVSHYADGLMQHETCFEARLIMPPSLISERLQKELPLGQGRTEFIDDVVIVADMFSCLFELEQVGLRMSVLNKAMCPKFHVDRVPCRLITTYAGAGTEWHPFNPLHRTEGGLVEPPETLAPERLYSGDVALLKGELWEGNEGRGLVHRSPSASDLNRRLVMTLDFA